VAIGVHLIHRSGYCMRFQHLEWLVIFDQILQPRRVSVWEVPVLAFICCNEPMLGYGSCPPERLARAEQKSFESRREPKALFERTNDKGQGEEQSCSGLNQPETTISPCCPAVSPATHWLGGEMGQTRWAKMRRYRKRIRRAKKKGSSKVWKQ
jgi:hypothetical protein